MLKQDLGMAMVFFGAMGGDADKLRIPLAIILIGGLLILHDNR